MKRYEALCCVSVSVSDSDSDSDYRVNVTDTVAVTVTVTVNVMLLPIILRMSHDMKSFVKSQESRQVLRIP